MVKSYDGHREGRGLGSCPIGDKIVYLSKKKKIYIYIYIYIYTRYTRHTMVMKDCSPFVRFIQTTKSIKGIRPSSVNKLNHSNRLQREEHLSD